MQTDRLLLREWRESDLDVFTRLYGDPQVTRHLGDGATMDRGQTWRAIAGSIGHWVLRGYGQWVLERLDSGEVVGRSGLINPEGWPGLEAGWVIAPQHQGHGFATEAGGAALRYAFDTLGAPRVISLIYPDNRPSQRVAEKLGGARQPDIAMFGRSVMLYAYTHR